MSRIGSTMNNSSYSWVGVHSGVADTDTDRGTDADTFPTAPQNMHGSASPKGEARRAAPPSPSEAPGAAGTLLTRVRVK